jgi:hypothetical protein
MMTFKSVTKSNLFCTVLALAVSTVLFEHFRGSNNDFQVYFQAGRRYAGGQIPWNPSAGTSSMFLYGPLTASFFAIYQYLGANTGLVMIRLGTLGVTLALSLVMTSKQNLRIRLLTILLIFSFFSLRSNLENGSIGFLEGIIGLFGVFLTFKKKHPRQKFSMLVSGFFLALPFDYKPQLYFMILGVVYFLPKWSRISFLFTISIAWSINLAMFGLRGFDQYISTLLNRTKGLSTGIEQMDLRAILIQLTGRSLLGGILWILICATALILITRNFYPVESGIKLMFCAQFFLILSVPFLHATDLFLIFVLYSQYLVAPQRRASNCIRYMGIAFCISWTNSFYFSFIILVLLSLWIYLDTLSDFRKISRSDILNIACSFFVLLLPICVLCFPESENVTRHVINYLGISFVCLSSFQFAKTKQLN